MSDMTDQSIVTKEKLVADLRTVVTDAEELLRLTASQAGEKVGELRVRMQENLVSARHKLADDNVLALLDPAQPVVTPKLMEQAILEVALGWVSAGLMENFDLFKETLDVTRDTSDRNRLNCVCHPDVVNQLRVFAALIQFKL